MSKKYIKVIDWIKGKYYSLIAWFILRDGHTTHHYRATSKNIITDENGFIKTWIDSSGNGNDLKSYPNTDVDIIEVISRDSADGKFKGHSIYMALKYKYKIK